MKIDIHVHTKKTKKGDAETRNIDPSKFARIVSQTDVKIIAVTNHNHFDKNQYKELVESVDGTCQIWPGIELDVMEDGRRAHLIVIVNPKIVDEFDNTIKELLKSTNEDAFTIGIKETVDEFGRFDAIYVAHYHSKRPNLLDKDVENLSALLGGPERIIKEATNAISAGIYISHGHNSIYGSDVQNWDSYEDIARNLPDLRLPVESFEQFTLLLDKDVATINTLLDKKSKDSIQLNPFSAAELVDIDIFDDINIIFGSKGTGKTEILKALSKYYNGLGHTTDVYESGSKNIEEEFDLKGSFLSLSSEELGFEECLEEIALIRGANEKDITNMSSYLNYYAIEETNRISKSISIKNFSQLDESASKRAFEEVFSSLKAVRDFFTYIDTDKVLSGVIDEPLLIKLRETLDELIMQLKLATSDRMAQYKSSSLFNNLISTFVSEISKKTGQPAKPIKSGFQEYASNRIKIERSIIKIQKNISIEVDEKIEDVGSLGEKGQLKCKTSFKIQDGSFSKSEFKPLLSVKKTAQKNVAKQLDLIGKLIYTNSLFEKITELNEIENGEILTKITDLVQFKKEFILDDEPYKPSSGESSMVLLHNELIKEKDIYLIDEPEKSLGNDYISDVIVPLLKLRAKLGKKIIIATHDANIAVRTLPYNSIYREHYKGRYYTYSGNPFLNGLVCSDSIREDLDWKDISMKTLEGGRGAFGERGKIYGNT